VKAIVQRRYGAPADVLALADIDRPHPQDDEVLVRVRAASVHPDVWHVVRGVPYVLRVMCAGLRRPKTQVPGTDLAGEVAGVGKGVTGFQSGDTVFGESLRGHQWHNGGTYAEYACVPADGLARKPDNVTFEQAASVATSGIIALSAVRREARVRPGQRVLVNGAAGGVGALALQIAKADGAEVTAVDSEDKLDLAKSLGAEDVIDYTRDDFTLLGARYDAIIDVPGNHGFSAIRRALTPDGTYVLIGHDAYGAAGRSWFGSMPRFFGLMARARFTRQLPPPSFAQPDRKESLAVLRDLLAAGSLTPAVDRTFPLDEAVEAIRYLERGGARGKIVLTI
jgi:NADPH:quinone reductase-like Zn-dependent oxidoreductase